MPAMIWLVMSFVFMDACLLATLNYVYNARWWYVWAFFAACFALNGIWFGMVKLLHGDKDLIYQAAWIWLAVFNAGSFLLPVLLFNVKISAPVVIGMVFIILGVVLMRLGA
jgi:hypothetical protein